MAILVRVDVEDDGSSYVERVHLLGEELVVRGLELEFEIALKRKNGFDFVFLLVELEVFYFLV